MSNIQLATPHPWEEFSEIAGYDAYTVVGPSDDGEHVNAMVVIQGAGAPVVVYDREPVAPIVSLMVPDADLQNWDPVIGGFWGSLKKTVKKHVVRRADPRRVVASMSKSAGHLMRGKPLSALQAAYPETKRVVRAARKIAKDRVVRRVSKQALKALRSKQTGAGLTAAAAAFPAVGVPALAAYATANTALRAAENFKRMKQMPRSAIRNVKRAMRSSNPAVRRKAEQFKRRYDQSRAAYNAVKQTVDYAKGGHPAAQRNMRILRIAQQGRARRKRLLANKARRMARRAWPGIAHRAFRRV